MVIAKAEASSRRVVPKATGKEPGSKCSKPKCKRASRAAIAKVLLFGAILAVDATADPGAAPVLSHAIACYVGQHAPP